jgi:hypothetical protein
MNNYGKLICCTERHKPAVEFYLALATAIVPLGRLIRQAWSCHRWRTRPRRRPETPPIGAPSNWNGLGFALVPPRRPASEGMGDTLPLAVEPDAG